ncbi:acyl-CoA thioesterase [Marinoscillum sp.]|uniref:acyl-CoA thioesterase n=1 Tax=Marinoscillum sp. TaxID=2024838 RepID=UPI003BAD0063
MTPIQYSEEIKVSVGDLDELRHVNNVVYLKWVQQVAENHWRSAASQLVQDQFIWVVLSHFIQYRKPAVLDDNLTLLTYVGDFRGARSIRHVEIKRGTELIADAKTEWCMLDVETQRPRRVTDEVSRWFFKT